MTEQQRLSAEEFAEQKFDLGDGGRWVELVAGEVVSLDPPEAAHGTTVLNLSKALARYLVSSPNGYACFELGLLVARNPDTVRCPAMSYFVGADRFAQSDKTVTETKPALVVEIASSNARRRELSRRVEEYQGCGIELVWVIDPIEEQVHILHADRQHIQLDADQTLSGILHASGEVLDGFEIRIRDLFAEPDWWMGARRK